MRASAPRSRVPSHDWWVYLLVASMSGVLIFDEDSYVLYRQHQQNNGVANLGWQKLVSRIYSVLTGKSTNRIKTNLECLDEFRKN